jgi:TolB-like protein/DNA-binding winged helix-turn-helix (wHTH) protein/tetratricopeptide (TPR) repeat protein
VSRTLEVADVPRRMSYRVHDLTVDVGRHRVQRAGVEIPLPALSFDLLRTLIEHAPNLLTYDQLMHAVWPGVVVNQETVTQRVKLVRDALGDDPQDPRYIAAVRGCGYRLIAAVEPIIDTDASASHAAAKSAMDGVAPSAIATPRFRRWRWAVPSGIAIGTIIVVILITLTQVPDRQAKSVVVAAPPRTIAVLPFVNLSGDDNNEYVGDGLTDDLINRIGQIPELRVIARSSAFVYKGSKQDVRTIGTKLGVATVLEGGVRRVGDRVRVNAQLIDVRNGYQLWSDSYERDMSDRFAIHDDIASRIAQVVGIRVAEPTQRPTANRGAYDLYLRGLTAFAQRQDEVKTRQAIAYFEGALQLDPGFVQAQAALALALSALASQLSDARAAERAASLARNALAVDPSNSDAHTVLASYNHYDRYDFLAAEEAYRAAIKTGPNNVTAHYWYGDHLRNMGRMKEAYTMAMAARSLDPASAPVVGMSGAIEVDLGYLSDAERTAEVLVQLGWRYPHLLRGYIAIRRGDLARAFHEYNQYPPIRRPYPFTEEVLALWVYPARPIRAGLVRDMKQRCPLTALDRTCYTALVAVREYEAAFAYARNAFAERRWDTEYLWQYYNISARSQPGFKELVRDIGLVDYWRKTRWSDYCRPKGEDFECE